MDEIEISIPSVDVCGWCSDSECDGVGCIARLDPNDADDIEALDQLHRLLRAGRAFLGANAALASAEGRDPERWWR